MHVMLFGSVVIGAVALVMLNVLLSWADSHVGATNTNTDHCTSLRRTSQIMHHRRALSVEKLQSNEEKENRYHFPTKITAKDHTNQFLKVLQLPKFYTTEKKIGDTYCYI